MPSVFINFLVLHEVEFVLFGCFELTGRVVVIKITPRWHEFDGFDDFQDDIPHFDLLPFDGALIQVDDATRMLRFDYNVAHFINCHHASRP